MKKRNFALFVSSIFVLIFITLFILKQSLNLSDFLIIIRVLLLFVTAFLFSMTAKNEKNATKSFILGLSKNFALIIACVILLNQGSNLYRAGVIWKALVFFFGGLIMAFWVFYTADKDADDYDIAIPEYKKVPNRTLLIKSAIAVALALLGVFFIKRNMAALAMTAYFFMLVQLFLIIRPVVAATDADKIKTVINPYFASSNTAKIMSLIMICLALYFYYFSLNAFHIYNVQTSIACLIIGAMLFGYAPYGENYVKPAPSDNDSRRFDIVFSIFIFILGIVIFGYKLMDIPPGIHGDEALSVVMAKQLGANEVFPVVLDSPGYNGMSLLYYWMFAMIGKIWGTTIITGRWFSVVTGATGLIFVYLLVKNIFNRRAAVLTSLLLSTFFMMVFYSRNAILWIHVPAFAAAAYYFFFKGIKDSKPFNFIMSGLLLSLNLCFYSAAKASPFVLIVLVILMLINSKTRKSITANAYGLILFGLTMLLVFSPVIDYILHFPSLYFLRMKSMSYLHGIPGGIEQFRALTENIIRNIQMFMTVSADGYCHNLPQKPFFDGFAAFAAITGAGYLIYTWKKPASMFVILWALFGLLPGFLSRLGPEDPYPARTVLAIPALIIIIAIGVERLLSKLESLWPKFLKYAAILSMIYFTAWFGFVNLHNYFVVFNNDPHTQTYYRYVDKLNADYMVKNSDKQFLVSPFLTSNYYYGMVDKLTYPKIRDFVTTSDVSLFELNKIYDSSSNDTVLIGEGIYYKLFPLYKIYFPSAKAETFWDPNFWFLDYDSKIKYCYEWKYPDKVIALNYHYAWFSVYDNDVKFVRSARVIIPASDKKTSFALNAVYHTAGKISGEGPVSFPINISAINFDTAEIKGLIDIPEYGSYNLFFEGCKGSLTIDNRPSSGAVKLYQGLHRIKLDITKKTGEAISLKWKVNGGQPADIDRKYLINADSIYGLVATYSNKGAVIYRQLEPMINYRMYYYNQRPAYKYTTNNGYNLEWNGRIKIDEGGIYNFKLHTLYDAVITIDGRTVFTRKNGTENTVSVMLSKGFKVISIVSPYTYISNYWDPGSTIRFMYKKGNNREFGPVTYDMLYPQ